MPDELYSRSPIHGFSFIHDSRTKRETVFWLFVMALFFVVLSIDIVKLSKQYLSQDTLSKVEMVNKERTRPPPFIACFDVGVHTIIHILEVDKGFSIKEDLSEYKVKEEFLTNLTSCSEPKILATVCRYLAKINDHDSLFLKRLNSFKSVEARHDQPYEIGNFLELEKTIEELDIGLNELKKSYAKFVINMYVKRATLIQNMGHGQVETNVLSEDTSLHSVDLDGKACVVLNIPEFIYRGPPRPLLEIEVNYTNLHASVGDRFEYYFGIMLRSLHVIISHHKTNPSNHLVQMVATERSADCTLEIGADYKSLSEENAKTSSCGMQSVKTCHELCISEMIQYYCQCNPLFLRTRTSTGKTCHYMKHYRGSCASVGNLTLDLYPDFTKNCLKKCVPPCQLTTYISNQHGIKVIPRGEVKFYGTLAMFNYPKYQHVFAITWESFMGAFGGTLGIWFGASILSVIHLIFIVFDYFCNKKQIESHTNPRPSTSLTDTTPAKQ